MDKSKSSPQEEQLYPYVVEELKVPRITFPRSTSTEDIEIIGIKKDLSHQNEIVNEKISALDARIKMLEQNKSSKDLQFFQIKVILLQFLVGGISFVIGNFFPIIKDHIK